jgi:hypothetical protein
MSDFLSGLGSVILGPVSNVESDISYAVYGLAGALLIIILLLAAILLYGVAVL